jgi:hypothetical protein
VILALLFAAAVPSFSCRGVNAKDFCCVATVETAKWQIYAPQEPDRSEGKSACFVADREWRAVQMTTPAEEGYVYRLRVLVKSDGGRVLFVPYRSMTENE